jgi:hypothetical protein
MFQLHTARIIGVQLPTGAEIFLLASVKADTGAHPASYQMDTRICIYGVVLN